MAVASESKTLTVLLMLEAIDKASSILEGISGKIEAMGAAAEEAAARANMSGEELEAAQIKAEAAANAAAAAEDAAAEAQARLAASTQAVRDVQSEASAAAEQFAAAQQAVKDGTEAAAGVTADSYAKMSEAAQASADAVKTATAEQIAALDELAVAQKASADRVGELAAANSAAGIESEEASGGFMDTMAGLQKTALVTAAAVAGIGYESVKAAANFQQATTVLQTSGGETAAQMASVRQGILNIASSTGTATQELINGMYMIGSAGFTGAQGLTVLKTAAQGAKAEGADLSTVGNALTTVMKDYGMTAAQSVPAMDEMIAVVQNGKTTTEALAGSLSNVLPIASAAGLSFAQVGGALATMTGEGMSAQQGTQDLANVIRSLKNPTSVATNEMMQMGLNSNTVAQQLGTKGLTGTLSELTEAITAHMGKNGQILLSTFQSASAAAADAKQEIAAMPSSLQSLANAFLDGSVTSKQWQQDLYALSGPQANLMKEFATTAEKAGSFNSMLTSGQYGAQTYTAALSKMLGGATGLNVGLMLTGGNMQAFQKDVAAVGDAGQKAGQDVNGWAEIQGNMNQKLSELKESVAAAGIELGTALLPMLTKLLSLLMGLLAPILQWIEHNKSLASIILIVAGALSILVIAINLGAKAMEAFKFAMAAVTDTDPILLAIMAIAVVALLIITHWNTVKKWFGDFWDWIEKVFDDGVNFVKGHVNEIAAAAIVILGPLGLIIAVALEVAKHWDAVKRAVGAVWDWMKQAAGDVAHAVSAAWTVGTKAVIESWALTIAALRVAWSLVGRAWDDTGGKAVTAIAHVWDQVSQAFSKEWAKISGDLSSIWQSLVTIWNSTGGALISAISGSWDLIVQTFDEAAHEIEDVVEPPFDFIVDLVRMSMGLAVTVLKVAWDVIQGVVRVGVDYLEMIAKAGMEVVEEAFSLAWGAIEAVFRAVWDVISGIVEANMDVVEGIFRAGWDIVEGIFKEVWDMITTTVNTVLDIITGLFKIFADLFTGNWSKLWNDVKSLVTTVWHDITNFFDETLGNIEHTVTSAVAAIFDGFIHGIEDAISGVKNALADVWHGIESFFADAGNWLLTVGEQIVEGLIHGIENMMGTLINTAKSVASTVVSYIKDPLKILSPSRVMADEVGKFIPEGIAVGITDNLGVIQAAAKKAGEITVLTAQSAVTGGARSIGSSLVNASAAGLAASGGLGSGGGLQIIVQGGNTLMSDSDQTKFANMIGQKVVGQLNAAGHRIPMQ